MTDDDLNTWLPWMFVFFGIFGVLVIVVWGYHYHDPIYRRHRRKS